MSDEAEAILGTLTKMQRHLERFHKCAACDVHHATLLKAITNWVNKEGGSNASEKEAREVASAAGQEAQARSAKPSEADPPVEDFGGSDHKPSDEWDIE